MRTLSALHSGSGRVCRCPAGRSSGACEGVCDLPGGGFWVRDGSWAGRELLRVRASGLEKAKGRQGGHAGRRSGRCRMSGLRGVFGRCAGRVTAFCVCVCVCVWSWVWVESWLVGRRSWKAQREYLARLLSCGAEGGENVQGAIKACAGRALASFGSFAAFARPPWPIVSLRASYRERMAARAQRPLPQRKRARRAPPQRRCRDGGVATMGRSDDGKAGAGVMVIQVGKLNQPGEVLPFPEALAAPHDKRYKSAFLGFPSFLNPNPLLRRHPPPPQSPDRLAPAHSPPTTTDH